MVCWWNWSYKFYFISTGKLCVRIFSRPHRELPTRTFIFFSYRVKTVVTNDGYKNLHRIACKKREEGEEGRKSCDCRFFNEFSCSPSKIPGNAIRFYQAIWKGLVVFFYDIDKIKFGWLWISIKCGILSCLTNLLEENSR